MKKSPNIAFYTCCNSVSFSKVQLFLRSAKKQNIDVKVLGEGLEWSANSLRLPLILKELKDVKDDTIVLVTDAFDVLYVQNANSIYEKFIQGGYKILFAAEKWYSHQYEEYKDFYDSIKVPYDYKYLNAGTFMGYKKYVCEMIDNILSYPNFHENGSDQRLYGKYCFENPETVTLDYCCDIFWCTAGEWEILPELYDILNGFVLNKLTGTYPAIIHIPYSKKYYNVLLRLAEDMGDVVSR